MIVDTLIFMNELDILEIRLATLYDHVDRFVIVESNQSFSTLTGKEAFVFETHRARFAPYLDKIVYIALRDEYQTPGTFYDNPFKRLFSRKNALAWKNEAFTRDCILRGLADCRPDDVVMISDVDEFVRPEAIALAIERLRESPVVGFEQRMYRYFLNCFDYDAFWRGTKLTTCGTFRSRGPEAVKACKKYVSVPDSGWHFCSIGSMDQLLHKVTSYSHFDRCLKGRYRDVAYLEELLVRNVIEKGVDIYKFSDSKYRIVAMDGIYPPYLIENLEKFRHLIYQGPVRPAGSEPAREHP